MKSAATRHCQLSTASCLLFLVLLSLFCACSQGEEGESSLTQATAEFGDVYVNAEKRAVSIVTDGNDSLLFSPPYASKLFTKGDSTYRTITFYNKGDARNTQVISITPIPTISMKESAKLHKDSIHTDPVRLTAIWKSRNGKYLNFSLRVLSGTADASSVHKLGLLLDSVKLYMGGRRHAYVRLFHDQAGIPEFYSSSTYFSLPLSTLSKTLKTADSISIAVNTYDGWRTMSFTK